MFIRRITSCSLAASLAVILKCKKVLEECLVEYARFNGSNAGVRMILLLLITTSSRLPESKSDETVILAEL